MFYICLMGKIQNMKQVRIELICQKIKQGASIGNIINYVNKKINTKEGIDVNYSKRTVESDIKSIRKGDFECVNKDINGDGKHKFYINYII